MNKLCLPQSVIDLLPVAIYICSAPSAHIVQFNRTAAEMWGREPELNCDSDRYCGSFKVLTSDGIHVPHEKIPMACVLETGVPVHGFEGIVERPDSSRIRVFVNIDPIRDETGKIIGAINVFQDITKRMETDAALRTTQSQLNQFINSGLFGVQYWTIDDHGGRITDANDVFVAMTGYTREQMHSGELRWEKITSPEHGETERRAVQQVLTVGVQTPYEKEFIAKDGTRVPVLMQGAMLDRKEQSGMSLVIDLSELHAMRAKAKAMGTRMTAIVEGSEDAIVGYTLDGVVTDWNQAATRLYGYSSEEVIGQNLSLMVPPSRMNELLEVLKTVTAGERIQQFETVRQRKDGSLVEVSFTTSPITGLDGTINGGSSIVRNITSRKRMEERLRRSEERFRLVALATKDVIWDWDIRSGRVWRSETFWGHFGYPPRDTEPDVAGWKDLLHSEDRDRVWNGFQTALLRRSDSYEIEYRFQRADGSYAAVLDRAFIVYDDTGQPTRAIGAITDLSERRELEEQFRQAQKMEAVGRLAGGVAHDFNNLLMVITAYTEMTLEQLSPEDGLRNNIWQVQKAAERGASLTRQLLAFSRKQVLLPRIIDLNSVVEDTLKMIQRLIGEDIELNVALDKPIWAVKADPGQIVQVLMNLCVNARDALRDRGELRIETKNVSVDVEAARERPTFVPGNFAVLVVRDTGTGMTKQVLARLFEPFFTTKESGRGTGLGLSTVYGIVKQSGGYIWVDSEVGRGSTFSVYLPAVDAPLTTTITPEIKSAEGQGEIILLVEDEDALRESISTFLGLHGYKVLEASNGAQAVDIASQHAGSIQVLITDIILPKLSGAEVAREVARTSPQAVTLYMSGYTDRELIDYDPANVRTGFLQKPFGLRTLLQKLREMITARG